MFLSSTKFNAGRGSLQFGCQNAVQSASENKELWALPRSETYDKPRGLYSESPAE